MVSELLIRGLKQFLGQQTTLEDLDMRSFNADGSEALMGEVIYDPDNMALEVTYTSGVSYVYWGVGPQKFRRFRESGSRGQYINFAIKPNYLFSRGEL